MLEETFDDLDEDADEMEEEAQAEVDKVGSMQILKRNSILFLFEFFSFLFSLKKTQNVVCNLGSLGTDWRRVG